MKPRTLFALAVVPLVVSVTLTLRAGAQDDVVERGVVSPPEQPIAFSHRQHVSGVGMDCQLCHAYARRGPVSGFPSVERCTGCHSVVRPDRPEIEKVLAYHERGEPIPWVRVHDLPDYVRFTHKRHVRAGIGCDTCHGEVGRMDVVDQFSPLTMGWCLSCHTQRQASIDCLTCHY